MLQLQQSRHQSLQHRQTIIMRFYNLQPTMSVHLYFQALQHLKHSQWDKNSRWIAWHFQTYRSQMEAELHFIHLSMLSLKTCLHLVEVITTFCIQTIQTHIGSCSKSPLQTWIIPKTPLLSSSRATVWHKQWPLNKMTMFESLSSCQMESCLRVFSLTIFTDKRQIRLFKFLFVLVWNGFDKNDF